MKRERSSIGTRDFYLFIFLISSGAFIGVTMKVLQVLEFSCSESLWLKLMKLG
jgi:hypothetical protein